MGNQINLSGGIGIDNKEIDLYIEGIQKSIDEMNRQRENAQTFSNTIADLNEDEQYQETNKEFIEEVEQYYAGCIQSYELQLSIANNIVKAYQKLDENKK